MEQAVVIKPIQWASLPKIDEVAQITDADYAILRDIRAVLERHNALDRFGINLLHRHFDLEPDEVLVEYTDEENRIQTCRVERMDDFKAKEDSIETNWVFDRTGPSVICRGGCVYNQGHRRQHI